jgi:hypothetical protein
MVSSRDRKFVSVEMTREVIARTPPPAFLFPNQRCQRPEPPWRPHRLAPGVGGGGDVVASVFRVNRLFRGWPLIFADRSPPDQKAKTVRQGAEGVPLRLAGESAETAVCSGS